MNTLMKKRFEKEKEKDHPSNPNINAEDDLKDRDRLIRSKHIKKKPSMTVEDINSAIKIMDEDLKETHHREHSKLRKS